MRMQPLARAGAGLATWGVCEERSQGAARAGDENPSAGP